MGCAATVPGLTLVAGHANDGEDVKRALGTMCAVVVVGSAGVVPAVADTESRPIPLGQFYDLVADPAHDRVFISGGDGANSSGSGTDEVVVADADGHVTGTIPDLHNAMGMVLSRDDDRLYVALKGDHALGIVDTTDLSVRKVSTGDACPLSVAPAAGLVWIVDRCGGELAHLLAVDPDTGQRSGSLLTVSGGGSVLVSSPETRPQTLVLGDTDQSPSRLHLLQVTGGPIPTVAETAETETGALTSVAFTPDGRSLVVAYSSNGYYHQVLSADDLSEAEHYDAQAYPDAVAVRGDGMVAAGFFAWYSPDIYLYRPGTNASPRRYEIGDTEGRTLQPDGLAFGNDRLYAVTADVSKHNPWLHVIDPSTPSSVSAVPDRLTYDNGDTARVTVHLDPFTVGQQVRVRATVSGRTYEVGTGPVDEAGEFSVATPVSRTTTFSAVLLGADGQPTGAAPAAVAVSVRASVSTIMVGGYASRHGYRLYHAGRRALTKTTFAPHRGGVCVRLRLQGRVSTGTWRTFRLSDCLPVNDAGHVWRHVNQHRSVGDRLRVRAEWAGDRVNAARTGDWAFARFTR
jgi:hypothetical protein